jgi:hypothetical protein
MIDEVNTLEPNSTNKLLTAIYEFISGSNCRGTDDVVPSNTVDLVNPGYFEVTGAGTVKFDPIKGAAGQTRSFDAKECSKFRVKRIYATGTTATGIKIYY